jgi:hypothetical protein
MKKSTGKKIAKSTENEVLEIVVEAIKGLEDKESFTISDIYQLVETYMKKNNLLKKGDLETYQGTTTTKLRRTVYNLVSHKKLNDLFDINIKEGKSELLKKDNKGQLFLDYDAEEINPEIDYRIGKIKQSDLDEVRTMMISRILVNGHVSNDQAEALIKHITDSNLRKWINEKGGLRNFKKELVEGKVDFNTAKDVNKIKNFQKTIDLLFEAIMSGEPVLIIRDYDNDGVSIDAALNVLLDEVNKMGIKHKVEIRQTKGGDIRGIDSTNDITYFKEIREKYPTQELKYLFTFDNGVSNFEEVKSIFTQMNYKKPPIVNIVDHHTKDENAVILDNDNYFHTNPELTDGYVPKVAAGAMAAEISKQVYIKMMGNKTETLKLEHFDRVAEFSNQADMVSCDIEHLHRTNYEQSKTAEVASYLNTYVKYESFFREQDKFESFLNETVGEHKERLMKRFLHLSEKAQIIFKHQDKPLEEVFNMVNKAKAKQQNHKMSEYSISALRGLVVKGLYSVDKSESERSEYAMEVFKELKELDKEIVKVMRREPSKYITLDKKELAEQTGSTTFLRIYDETTTTPTKLIDAAFPKPTTAFTASLKISSIEGGYLKYSGGFRSNLPGGHTNFKSLNNDINQMDFLGHHNAAGIRGKLDLVKLMKIEVTPNERARAVKLLEEKYAKDEKFRREVTEQFELYMNGMIKEANEVANNVTKKITTADQIIKIDGNDIYQLEAISSMNAILDSHLFTIKTGFKVAIKGDLINQQLKKVDQIQAWGALPLTFGGQALVVPNTTYKDDEYVVFESIGGGSWIAGDSTVESKLQTISGMYDLQKEEIELRSQEKFNKDKALVREKMTREDQEEVFAGRGQYADINYKKSRGLIIQQMLNQNIQTSIVYDIEATGSTRGVEDGDEGKTDESRTGKTPSEVINGQFVVRNIVGGKTLRKDAFENRLFYLNNGTKVLLTPTAFTQLNQKYSDKVYEELGKKIITEDILKPSDYEEIFSMEVKRGEVVYNQELDVELIDFLSKIKEELPFSVVSLTHITKDILSKYGHDPVKINEEILELMNEWEGKLEEGKKISIAAHNIGYDAGMTPQSLPFFEKIAKSPLYVQIDTTHSVRSTEAKSISYAEFKYGDFSAVVQGFENDVEWDEPLFSPEYVLADFLTSRKEGVMINLVVNGEMFEYRNNGQKLSLLYIDQKSGKETVVIDDVNTLTDEELLRNVSFEAKKAAKYSMQKVLDLLTLDGILFANLSMDKINYGEQEVLFDQIGDDVLTMYVQKYMKEYRFTQSIRQNLNMFKDTVILNDDKRQTIAQQMEEMVIAEMLEDTSESEKEEYFTKAGLGRYYGTGVFEYNQLSATGKTFIKTKTYLKEQEISSVFAEFLIDNKELGELYELKVVAYRIFPNLVNLPYPMNEEQLGYYVGLLNSTTKVDKLSLTNILKLINNAAIKLDKSPFKLEPHANIGVISDAAEESLLIAEYKVMYGSNFPLNKNELDSIQTSNDTIEILKTQKARQNAAFVKAMESNVNASLEKDQKLRVAIKNKSLLSGAERAYIVSKPGVKLTDEEYEEIVKDVEAYYTILALENTQQSDADKYSKKQIDPEAEAKALMALEELTPEQEKELKTYQEHLELTDLVETLGYTKSVYEDRIKNQNKFEVSLNKEAWIQIDLMEKVESFFEYLIEKAYFPIKDESKYEKIMENPVSSMDIEQIDPIFKDSVVAVRATMNKVFDCNPKLREERDYYNEMLDKFLEYWVIGKGGETNRQRVNAHRENTYQKGFNTPLKVFAASRFEIFQPENSGEEQSQEIQQGKDSKRGRRQ